MRALLQRVSGAHVTVRDDPRPQDEQPNRAIGRGLVVLLGVGETDTEEIADKLWSKISKLRIFADENDKTNLSLSDIDGQVMVVSQFTLYANCKKGNRPSFIGAGCPDHAEALYLHFVERVRESIGVVATGEFGADMSVQLSNDGPFTIWLDSDDL